MRLKIRFFTIDSFLEKVVSEHPDLINYSVLAVKQEFFGNIQLADPFLTLFGMTIQVSISGLRKSQKKEHILPIMMVGFSPFYT